MTEILLVNLVKLINSRRSKFDFHASFHLYTEFESIHLNFKRSHQIIFKFNFCIRLEESLERRVRAETSSIEAAIAKAEDPASSLSVNLTNQISKSLQVQLQNEMKKDWLPFFIRGSTPFYPLWSTGFIMLESSADFACAVS